MEVLTAELESRTDFFKKIGPDIARQMSEALQKLTAEEIKVEFSSIETLDQNAIFIETNEKCFGSYVTFKSPKVVPAWGQGNFEGVVVAIFPLASTKALTAMLSKRFLKTANKENIDNKLKLSAFKEAANILVLAHINGMANALKVKIEMGMPKFACFRNVEHSKPALLTDGLSQDSLVSVGQFNISAVFAKSYGGAAGRQGESSSSFIKGRFIVVY